MSAHSSRLAALKEIRCTSAVLFTNVHGTAGEKASCEPTAIIRYAHSSYFDTVSDDNLRVGLRHLTLRPHHKKLHPYVAADSVSTVLDVGGVLARAASLKYSSVGGTDGIPFDTDVDASIIRSLLCPTTSSWTCSQARWRPSVTRLTGRMRS